MLTLAAYYESVDQAGAYANMAAPADQHLTVNTPRIQVPSLNQLLMVMAGLENAVAPRGRITTPSLRQRTLLQVAPISVAAAGPVVPTSPHAAMDMASTPVKLVTGEQMTFEALATPVAAQIQWCGVLLGDGPAKQATGDIFTTRATGTTTCVAGAWTLCPLTFDENLPRGKYQVVGAKFMGATCKMGRLVFPGYPWRPGFMGCATVDIVEHWRSRGGNLGVWGEWEDVDNLQAEFLCGAGDTTQIVYLDLIQVRAGGGS